MTGLSPQAWQPATADNALLTDCYTDAVSAPLAEPHDVTLAILAGGKGSRMGMPKAELLIGRRPILAHLLNQMHWAGPRWLITAPGREHPKGAQGFDQEWADPQPGMGPLRGILTALEHLATPLLVVATVDMPRVTANHLSWLVNELRSKPELLGLMCRRNIGAQEQVEPFPLVLRREAEGTVRARLESGRRSVHGLLDEAQFALVPAPADWDSTVWTNLNIPQDLLQ